MTWITAYDSESFAIFWECDVLVRTASIHLFHYYQTVVANVHLQFLWCLGCFSYPHHLPCRSSFGVVELLRCCWRRSRCISPLWVHGGPCANPGPRLPRYEREPGRSIRQIGGGGFLGDAWGDLWGPWNLVGVSLVNGGWCFPQILMFTLLL